MEGGKVYSSPGRNAGYFSNFMPRPRQHLWVRPAGRETNFENFDFLPENLHNSSTEEKSLRWFMKVRAVA